MPKPEFCLLPVLEKRPYSRAAASSIKSWYTAALPKVQEHLFKWLPILTSSRQGAAEIPWGKQIPFLYPKPKTGEATPPVPESSNSFQRFQGQSGRIIHMPLRCQMTLKHLLRSTQGEVEEPDSQFFEPHHSSHPDGQPAEETGNQNLFFCFS